MSHECKEPKTVQLTAVPSLFVNTTEGLCVVKVKEKAIELLLLQLVEGFVADGMARLVRLPENMVVTGSIVEGEKT